MFKARLKQKKIALLSAYTYIIIILAFGILSCSKNEKTGKEIFSFHGQTVQLLADGNFTASLAHGVKKSGTRDASK